MIYAIMSTYLRRGLFCVAFAFGSLLVQSAHAEDRIADILKNAPPMPEKLTGPVGKMDGPKQIIHGQCFIVTKGGTNIKLALVQVRIVSAELIDGMEREIQGRYSPRLEYWEKLAKEAGNRQSYEFAQIYLGIASDELVALPSFLPSGPHAKTDADGKFELTHTMQQPFVVVAFAQRKVGEDTERYSWRVPSSQIDEDGTLMLSNDNLRH